MSVRVKFIDIEGDARDVAQVLGSVMGQPLTTIENPTPPRKPLPEPPTPTPAAIVDVTTDTPLRVANSRSAQAVQIDGEMPTRTYDHFDDIPVELRWWNDSMVTCHIRSQPGLNVSMCRRNRDQIGTRRSNDETPPARSIADTCKACNKAIERHLRGETA